MGLVSPRVRLAIVSLVFYLKGEFSFFASNYNGKNGFFLQEAVSEKGLLENR